MYTYLLEAALFRPTSNSNTKGQRLRPEGLSVDLDDFPTTRYRGSKRKIIPWISEQLSQLDFTSALDVFGGTASVSYLLKKMGKAVTYNDHLRFNYWIGLALIENDSVTLTVADIAEALAIRASDSRRFVRDNFGGMYFTARENGWIDRVVAGIDATLDTSLPDRKYKVALLRYGLFQSCLIKRPFNLFHRNNLNLRLANVKREFGNKVTWEKKFSKLFKEFCLEASGCVFKGKKPCKATCFDASDLPEKQYDLLYLDPPYISQKGTNETADYHSSYHFLEGLCGYDEWEKWIDRDTLNRRMKKTEANDWSIEKNNLTAFDSLFEKFRKSIFVVSYKKYGSPSIGTLIQRLKRHGKVVHICSRHYKYALNHQNGSAKLNREVLIIAE